MRELLPCIAILIGLPGIASAQDFRPGDSIRLIEREIHIPAHPGPGDTRNPIRFVSGTLATLLGMDAGTGWVEIRGEALNIEQPQIGSITPRYIASTEPNGTEPDPVPGTVSWCPPKGSPDSHPSGRLRIATWNLGNLHSQDGEPVYTHPDPSVKRFTTDYERIKCYVRLFNPDILAVQEVDGEEALARVVDTDIYEVHVSDRPQGSLNGKKNTGFAFKRGLSVETKPDFEDLNTSGRVRYGARIDVTHNGQTIKLMSVHLKSRCFHNGSSSSACNTLMDQVPVLEDWIDDAASGPNSFIVLGDFNRRLNMSNDSVWKELDDSDPPDADLNSVTKDMPISCRDNKYTTFIDHIVFGKRAWQWVDRSSFRHMTYRQDDKEKWDKVSDHCPVVVEMWVQ